MLIEFWQGNTYQNSHFETKKVMRRQYLDLKSALFFVITQSIVVIPWIY